MQLEWSGKTSDFHGLNLSLHRTIFFESKVKNLKRLKTEIPNDNNTKQYYSSRKEFALDFR